MACARAGEAYLETMDYPRLLGAWSRRTGRRGVVNKSITLLDLPLFLVWAGDSACAARDGEEHRTVPSEAGDSVAKETGGSDPVAATNRRVDKCMAVGREVESGTLE
jgi:hypothetical protein